MKKFNVIYIIPFVLLCLIYSCDDIIQVYFDKPFPKEGKNLADVLGDKFSLIHYGDTSTFHIKFNEVNLHNLITESSTNDTVFDGTVSKFRGAYYLNYLGEDTGYWINCVKIGDNEITGFMDMYDQMIWIDSLAGAGELDDILIKSENEVSELASSDRKFLKKIYAGLLKRTKPDTLILYNEVTEDASGSASTTTGYIKNPGQELISMAYPNPAVNYIDLFVSEPGNTKFDMADISGKIVKSGNINAGNYRVDVSKLQIGTYTIRLTSSDREYSESLKIVVAR